MRIVVIGGVAGGGSAAARAKRQDPEAEVLMLEEGSHISYAACGLPYFLGGDVEDAAALQVLTPERFSQTRGAIVRTRNRVLAIDKEQKEVKVLDLDSGREYRESYDRLIIATGARPFIPPLEGRNLEGVYSLRTMQDALDLAGEQEASRAVIVGGGSIGCEMAEAFLKRGLEVTVIDKRKQLLPILDPDMAELVLGHLREKGATVELGQAVKSLGGRGRLREVISSEGSRFPADICLLALGVRPENSLAQEAGLQLGARGALAVDSFMATSHPDIYGAGDCCEATHLITGKKTWIPLGSTANKQGRVAGTNAAGGEMEFRGVLGTAQVKVCDLDVARTGLGEKEAEAEGIPHVAGRIKARSNSGYYPETGNLHLKIIAGEDGRILGAQAVGSRGVDKRIDVLATAIDRGMHVSELEGLDLGYAPPYSVPIDPLIVAGNIVQKKIEGKT